MAAEPGPLPPAFSPLFLAELAALLTPATARTLPPAERLAQHATDLAATAHALEAALAGGGAQR